MGDPSAHNEPPGEKVEWDKPRSEDPDISEEELAAMADDERAFALSLLAALPADGNRAIAPTSLRFAFGQTYAGARTISKAEIETALKFSLPPEKIHAGFNFVDLELEKRNLPPSGEVEGDDSVELKNVNQVFGLPNVAWEPPFLDILAASYGSSMYSLDFAGAPEPSRLAINQWVNDVTHDKIPELLPLNSISSAVTTVLVNAMYLKAPWDSPFVQVDDKGSFMRLDGTEASVDMMYGTQEAARHVQGVGYAAAELPLRGDQLAMVIILPDAGTFEQFAGTLDGPGLGAIFDALAPTSLEVTLPRFTVKADLGLKGLLMALGLVESFSDGDFSGMTPPGEAWSIDNVYHDVFVAVDEKGVEAAAASAVVLGTDGGPVGEESFIVDRPFLFAIRDRGTDSLLFFGHVLDPSQ